jgi:hypothetical protein
VIKEERETSTVPLEANKSWLTVAHPGYFGKNRDLQIEKWNRQYGEENWRLAWELKDGQVLNFERFFWQVYVASYTQYFLHHPDELSFITENYSYTYDKDLVSRADAFDPYTLYGKPGESNQFHHVALNIALEWFLETPFKGSKPLQVRQGKPGTTESSWPKGWRWSPGLIPAVRADLIPSLSMTGWWQEGTMEHFYQSAKVLQVRSEALSVRRCQNVSRI